MYVKMSGGKCAVIGRWPTLEEVDELQKLLSKEQTPEDKVVVVLDHEAPATAEDLAELLSLVKETKRLVELGD